MKIRATLLMENDKPISALGENPEEKIRKAYEAILALAMLKNPGDSAILEKIEIVEATE